MATPVNAALCAVLAVAFWTLLGFSVSRRLLPRPLACGAAPVMGWAAHSAATLPLFVLIGFSQAWAIAVGVVCAIASLASLRRPAPASAGAPISLWAFAAAALLALLPAAAIMPKISAQGVALADPISDHVKIAMIDAIARQGLPPIDPAFSAVGVPDHVAYYYLWHYSAAALALVLRVSGWDADIALTWFTAFASLSLAMGLAVWLGKRGSAAILAVVLAAAASLRPVLKVIFGAASLQPFLAKPTGFAGWLFQAAWAPQHLMAAACVVLAMLLIADYAQRQRVPPLVALVLVVVAGFESSTYVGGVTFAIAALAAAPVLLAGIASERRMHFVAGMAVAAALVVGLAMPFLRDQLGTVAAHGGASPIVLRPFAVLGAFFPDALRRLLDLPAYWLILLPLEFPAAFLAGGLALFALWRSAAGTPERRVIAALTCLTAAGLIASWLLASTLGDNNDLALRAVVPALLVLIAAAAAGVSLWPRHGFIAVAALGGLFLSLPDTLQMVRGNIEGTLRPDSAAFAQGPQLWDAVRRHAPPGARVANNPLYLADLVPWPENMSWALLADRASCFAGRELALALAPMSAAEREAINAQFIRVFSGEGTAQDIDDMANKYRCDVVVVVPEDKAWERDPFASSPDYRLADARDGRWKIYVRR